jgi:hypothetical protein
MSQNFNLLDDIYYDKRYIYLYLQEGEELFDFRYDEGENFLVNRTIKRPIVKIGNIEVDDGYYDLESAYGYGGFYTNSEDEAFLSRAFEDYEKRCHNEKIIAEFIRFHPFNDFPLNHDKYLNFNLYDREVVTVSLKEDILSSYRSKVRNIIRRASEKVTIEKSENIKKFIELYHLTMKKNEASSFYFFNKKLFEELYTLESVELYEVILENETIAMGFFMMGSDILHYHLSANTDISYKINANYALLYAISELGKADGKKYFLLGGGTTSLDDDPLLKFKKKFSKETKPFYISGKIYNQEVYKNYLKLWEEQSQENIRYFLKYRLELV